MPAKSKQELLETTIKEFNKLKSLMERIEPRAAMKKRADDTSVKDVIAHRAHWIDLFLGWYWDGLAGEEVHFPAKGYKWNDLKSYNSDLRQLQAGIDWIDAVGFLKDRNDALIDFIEGRSESELYGGPMKGAKNAWTPGRWAEAAGPSHFRSAAKYLRAALKEDTQ